MLCLQTAMSGLQHAMQASLREQETRSADLLSGKWQVSLYNPLHLLFDSLQVL